MEYWIAFWGCLIMSMQTESKFWKALLITNALLALARYKLWI